MFIWGYSTKLIQGPRISQACSHCQTKNLHVYGIKKVFNIFWIPCFPYKTTQTVICNYCSTTYEPDQLVSNLQDTKVKTPLRYFSGSIIFPILLGLGIISEQHTNKVAKEKTQVYLAAPQVGDKIIVKQDADPGFPYAIMKVVYVDSEKVDVVFGRYNFLRFWDARKRATRPKEEDYDREEFSFTLEEIKALKIEEIIR